MEIHGPEGPVHSWKDFLVHISIVTIGILIALGLEGIRESVHNYHLVRETRASVHVEMEENTRQAVQECEADSAARDQLSSIVDSLPQSLSNDPDSLRRRVSAIRVPNYYLTSTSWESALSTGALAHMSTAEATAYAGAAESVRIYSGLQSGALAAQARAVAFFLAHPRMTPDQATDGMERLIVFSRSEQALDHVCSSVQEDVGRALRASEAR